MVGGGGRHATDYTGFRDSRTRREAVRQAPARLGRSLELPELQKVVYGSGRRLRGSAGASNSPNYKRSFTGQADACAARREPRTPRITKGRLRVRQTPARLGGSLELPELQKVVYGSGKRLRGSAGASNSPNYKRSFTGQANACAARREPRTPRITKGRLRVRQTPARLGGSLESPRITKGRLRVRQTPARLGGSLELPELQKVVYGSGRRLRGSAGASHSPNYRRSFTGQANASRLGGSLELPELQKVVYGSGRRLRGSAGASNSPNYKRSFTGQANALRGSAGASHSPNYKRSFTGQAERLPRLGGSLELPELRKTIRESPSRSERRHWVGGWRAAAKFGLRELKS